MRSLAIAASKPRPLAAYVAFFLSGASSLIFQTIWTRMLHHVFGATSVAISTVLTVFMAGLGLGAWLGGRYANRIRHPIITYAVAEIGVGVFGLLVPLLVRPDGWLAEVNAFLRAELGAESGLFMVARFLCVAPILILPTTLMGSTLPLLTRHFVSVDQDAQAAGARVGILYALNTFGAATGPVLSAFVLLPGLGLSVTNVIACGMNFSLAAVILLARRPLLRGSWEPGQPLQFWPSRSAEPPALAEGEREPSASTEDVTPQASAADRETPAESGAETPARPKKNARGKSGSKKAKDLVEPQLVRDSHDDDTAAPKEKDEPSDPPIPELARKVAFLCFAASGAAALAYEVVWSRALAMTIGSSIYSFALILETFLIGIAGGAAAMSAFLGGRSRPYFGVAIASSVLVLLANVPWAIDIVNPADRQERFPGHWGSYVAVCLVVLVPIALLAFWAHRSISNRSEPSTDPFRSTFDWRPLVIVAMAALPVLAAVFNSAKYPGYLPQIILSVVASVAVFLVVAALMSRAPTLLLAVVQLFIAGATLVSYVWQDEIPRAFAQLVVSIPQGALPDHVGTVKFFMFVTVVLCTLPATLGMGAMFPLTVRIWTSGGERIASDVASVYAGNTVGSIVGSWLPGFVLFALIGAERTLHLGVALNMLLALSMLIAGVADPEEDRELWSWRRLAAIGLPGGAALVLAASAFIDVDTRSWQWWTRAGGAVAFGALSVVQYTWLRGRSEGRRSASSSIGWAMVVVPLGVGLALAAVMVTTADTDPWALKTVHAALRAFVVGVALTAAWANWREMSTPRLALERGAAR